jgi:hypothetical protein
VSPGCGDLATPEEKVEITRTPLKGVTLMSSSSITGSNASRDQKLYYVVVHHNDQTQTVTCVKGREVAEKLAAVYGTTEEGRENPTVHHVDVTDERPKGDYITYSGEKGAF